MTNNQEAIHQIFINDQIEKFKKTAFPIFHFLFSDFFPS